MNNPRVSAALSGLAMLYFAYSIFGATEPPSPTLNLLQWGFLLLSVIAFLGSLYQIGKGK